MDLRDGNFELISDLNVESVDECAVVDVMECVEDENDEVEDDKMRRM